MLKNRNFGCFFGFATENSPRRVGRLRYLALESSFTSSQLAKVVSISCRDSTLLRRNATVSRRDATLLRHNATVSRTFATLAKVDLRRIAYDFLTTGVRVGEFLNYSRMNRSKNGCAVGK